jgi:aminopeptidase N
VAWAAAPNFIWDASGWDGVLIQALYPPVALPLWAEAADMGRHTIMHHSRWYHYPYPTAINVNGPVGGMEYPMIVFCSERKDEKGLYFVTTHELGHEWFPMVVGSNERLYGWQDEGFNTFIDYFSYHDRFPTDTTLPNSFELGADMGTWVRFLQHYTGREAPIMEPQDRNPPALSGWLHYTKPAEGLHFLRNEVVDSTAFDAAFREYIRRWAFKHPTPADFFRTMNDALGEDLSWFWRSWFYRTDHLDQAVDSVVQQDSAGRSKARLFFSSRDEMVAPLDLAITLADGSTQRVKLPVEAWYRGSPFIYFHTFPAKVTRVVIDPQGVYPDVNRDNNVWSAPAP